MTSAGEWLKWALVFKAVFGSTSGGLTINAGTGLTGGGFIPLGGSGTISLAAAVSNFIEVTGTSQLMVPGTNYAANNAALVTLSLPVTSALGDQITVFGKGGGGWKIAQNFSQQVILGELSTTNSSGSLQSTYRYDIVRLTCIAANTLWTAIAESGNITVI